MADEKNYRIECPYCYGVFYTKEKVDTAICPFCKDEMSVEWDRDSWMEEYERIFMKEY